MEYISLQTNATKVIVDEKEKVCINCVYYEQYYRIKREGICCFIPTSSGYCKQKGDFKIALRKACKDFKQVKG